uniref:Orf327 n=1 Tax=Zancudomyces culisetae TaxID=1213189 RepID=Q3T4D3_ZANCU|nr:orf327 [Zancudomyces culisetae]AAW49481.1 orf327 [Zancudomyces culisetae]
MKEIQLFNLNPNWVTGFTQADGCFNITFTKKKPNQIRLRARFIISQHIKDELLILSIKNFFNCGIIIKNKKEIQYVVNSINDLINIIIPHFDKYPLKYGKYTSYLIFKNIIEKMKNKQHLTQKGLIDIINLTYIMNPLGKRKINKKELFEFLKIKDFSISDENNPYTDFSLSNKFLYQNEIDINFIGGLIQGDGCFNISFRKDLKIQAQLFIAQDMYSIELLSEIKKFFNCGNIIDKKVKMSIIEIKNINNLYNKILPLFNENLFFLDKLKQFIIFKQIVNLLYNKQHLTKDNKLKIVDLAYNMNNNGIKRKLTKEQFIQIIINKYK